MKDIKLIIFDIGNVIIKFDHMITCRKLAKISNFNADQIYNMLFKSPLLGIYEKGEINSRQYFRKVSEKLNIDISFDKFYKIWADIFYLNDGMDELIIKLAKKVRIFALSNTDQLHFKFFKNNFGVFKYMERFILSFEQKYRKPEEKIYRKAIKYAGLPARKIIFIDDLEENIEAFKKLGGNGIIFKGINNLKKELVKFNLN